MTKINTQEIVDDLKKILAGEVSDKKEMRDFLATDGSIFRKEPKLVVYPRGEKDVVLLVKYLNTLHDKGINLPVTARGKGTDQGGGALGLGVSLVFPECMDKLIAINKETVTVEPGIIYADLQKALKEKGRFLPPYPASIDFSTIGGAVANNAAGEKTIKYGSTRDYVKSLKVVLWNGDVIETRRLSSVELEEKKKQGDLEGEIYRMVDDILEKNHEEIAHSSLNVSKNSAGYDIWDVKRHDGSFDLGQLIVGSQGTLGIITEITLFHEHFNPDTTLIVGCFDDIKKVATAIEEVSPLGPSSLEIIDDNLIEFLEKHHPKQLKGLLPEKMPNFVLLLQFDDTEEEVRKEKAEKAKKIFSKVCFDVKKTEDKEEQTKIWRMRRGAAAVIWTSDRPEKALPIIEDAAVPLAKMPEFLEKTYKLLDKYDLKIAIWGHAGNANFHLQPFLDLEKKEHREKAIDLMEEFYEMIIEMGGTTAGEHNDGMLRAPYLERLYGKKVYGLFEDIKKIFDPKNLLNPGVKIGVTIKDIVPYLRKEYSMEHLKEHLPHDYDK